MLLEHGGFNREVVPLGAVHDRPPKSYLLYIQNLLYKDSPPLRNDKQDQSILSDSTRESKQTLHSYFLEIEVL